MEVPQLGYRTPPCDICRRTWGHFLNSKGMYWVFKIYEFIISWVMSLRSKVEASGNPMASHNAIAP